MLPKGQKRKSRSHATWPRLLQVLVALFVARDAPAHALATARVAVEPSLSSGSRETRFVSWAASLPAIRFENQNTEASAFICLYDRAGDIDESARGEFERIASREPEPHPLAARVEQLVFKAAHHFGAGRVVIVSGWRQHAGRHSSGEAVDFRLDGVYAPKVAAYLRGLPRVGVGIYTHPNTQFVHLDVRESSYSWIDGSPPGVHGWERPLWTAHSDKRDAAYQPEMDLPL
jgi:uncharacterized protein DUF882